MKLYDSVYEAKRAAKSIARSRNEVTLVVPVRTKFSNRYVILSFKNWAAVCNELSFPVGFTAVFDRNGVEVSTIVNQDKL